MEALHQTNFGRVVSRAESYTSLQGSVYAPGISKDTVGSSGLFLGMVTIPPEGRTKAHIHELHESAFYFLSGGEVELCTGEDLQHREVAHPGDYLYIPAGNAHVAVNRSKQPAVFIGVRNESTAQESVLMCAELDSKFLE